MATDVELAELDRRWWRNEAAGAFGADGTLDYGAADEIRRLTGMRMSDVLAALSEANEGVYEGTAEGGRALRASPGLLKQRAERLGTSLGEEALTLAGTATEAGSAHVADLASAYAEEHGVDYFDALIQIQKGEHRA